ncbi:MAG TPA: hypothetical protein VF284_10435 [Rhodanobacteraceae bacterium]
MLDVGSLLPMPRFAMQVCDCNDDNLGGGWLVDDAIREGLHLTTPDDLAQNLPRQWKFTNALQRGPGFIPKCIAQRSLLEIVVMDRVRQFLARRAQELQPQVRPSRSSNIVSASIASNSPAR